MFNLGDVDYSSYIHGPLKRWLSPAIPRYQMNYASTLEIYVSSPIWEFNTVFATLTKVPAKYFCKFSCWILK